MSVIWSIKAASVAGTRHRENNTACQDAHFFLQPCKGLMIAAAADGAGSARHSGIASTIAARRAVEWLATQVETLVAYGEDSDWSGLLDQAATAAADAVARESKRTKIPLPELATTLILVVARPDLVVSVQIGDGVVIVNDQESNLFALTTPQHGEYRNDTIFLNSKSAIEQAKAFLWTGNSANVAILTDGLELLALNLRDGSPHAPFFGPLWKFSQGALEGEEARTQLAAFLTSPRISTRTDDDLTLVLGCLKEETE